MDAKDIKTQIETHISNGDTEDAIQALVEYTKSTGTEQHENAVLLSGQFKQWKREKMLGVEQSDSELHRIEMGILAILKGDNLPDTGSIQHSSTRSASGGGSRSNTGLIIGSVIGVLAIALIAWMLGRETGSHHPETGADVETPVATTTEDAPPPTTIEPANEKPASVPATSEVGAIVLEAGQSMTVEQKYYSNDRNFYVRFGSDGNLCVYRNDDRFVAGSYQLGKPLDGVTAKLQDDGNFVVYGVDNKFIWASETHPQFDSRFESEDMKPVRLVLENDGALALYSAANRKVWTLTGGKL